MRSKRWGEMSNRQRVTMMLMTMVQVSLAVSAWADLAKRPRSQVNGSKLRWSAIIAVNFVGPLLYFAKGRRPAGR